MTESRFGPLRGRRVVDFSLYVPGSYCTMLLADLGAEVVKVEPVTGDPVRDFMPGIYEMLNGGKQVVPLNLKDADGLDLCHRLIRDADVVVEGFRPGVAERLGIGYHVVRGLSTDAVYCSLSGYGQDGPRSSQAGHDVNYTAVAGGFAVALAMDDVPESGPFAAADLGGALFAAVSICASLAARPPRGMRLDVSLTEASLALSAVGWGSVMAGGRLRARDIASRAPGYGIFRCRDDRWIALGAVEDGFWCELCTLLEVSELAAPPFDSHARRMKHRRFLAERMTDAVRRMPAAELLARAEELGLPISAVHTIDEVMADPHLRARGAIRLLPEGFTVNHPVRYDGRRPARSASGPRRAGVDQLAILSGLDVERLSGLVRSGVIGQVPAPAKV